MGTINVLNTEGIQGVLAAADEATSLASQAAAKAFEATQMALAAAGQVATHEAVVAGVLAIVRSELGQQLYNPRGAWSAERTYGLNDLVSYLLPDGTAQAFLALRAVPQGVFPTDTEYWSVLGQKATPPGFTLSFVLAGDTLTLAPGANAVVPVTVERVNFAQTELVFEVISDEPGLSGTVVYNPPSEETAREDEGLEEENLVEGQGQLSSYTLTLEATSATPEGLVALRLVARVAGWVDDPTSPLYPLTAERTLNLVMAKSGTVIASDATAVWGMSAISGYTLPGFLKDEGPNALHLTRLGDVRPNTRTDAWISEGTPGSVLHSPPLTGHSMDGPLDLGFIVRTPERLLDGAVVAAFASTVRKHDYAYVYKTSAGLRLRTAWQNAAGTGADTKDSAAIPLDTRVAISCDPATKLITLHGVKGGTSQSVALPAWPAAGVRMSAFAVLQSDGTVLQPSVGEIVTASAHRAVLEPIRRNRNAQRLVDDFAVSSSVARKGEFPSGTRLILEMKPGGVTADRTFYSPTHTLTLLGDAHEGAEGGVVTTGAVGSGAQTDFMPDVTWERDFTAAFVLTDFFAAPAGICTLALAGQNQANAFVKILPKPAGTGSATDDALFSIVPGEGIPVIRGLLVNVGKKPRHLFKLRYTASTRTLAVFEAFSGRALPNPLALPEANFTGPIRLMLGFVYKGAATEFSRTLQSGVWLGNRAYTIAEESAALAALGIAAGELTPVINNPGVPVTPPPNPDPTTGWSLVAPQVFDVSRLGSGDLKDIYDELAKPSWLYMANSKRDNKIGDHQRWKDEYADRYEIKELGGVKYRLYTGPTCGQYFLGRGISGMSFNVVSHAFRAVKDLRLLDVACYDVETLMDQARDDSGIESDKPDGFLGFTYGCSAQRALFFSPDDPRNTAYVKSGKLRYANNVESGNAGLKKMTGVEKHLEEGLMLGWMVTALGAHANIDKFSPTYEPVGDRSATPQFYRRVRDKAIKVYEETNRKWDKHWGDDRRSELPMHVRRTLIHSALVELAGAVAYAKIKGGANWKSTTLFAECKRTWKLIFGPLEKVGVPKNIHHAVWHEATHPRYGKCLFWAHQVARYSPSGTKDNSGEYIPIANKDDQYPHPNNYTSSDYGVMVFLHEEGCGFFEQSWLEKIANLILATMQLGEIFVRNERPEITPYPMNGGNNVESLVSPWDPNGRKSKLGATNVLAGHTASALAAFDVHGELEALARAHYKKYSSPQFPGVPAGLLYAAAKREGRL